MQHASPWQRIMATAILFALAGCAPATVADVSKLTDQQWIADVDELYATLKKTHKNLFHMNDEATFLAKVNAFNADIPDLEPAQILVRLMEITALAGDGHTNLKTWEALSAQLPIGFRWFGDDLRVIRTSGDAHWALGGKVVAIGGSSAAQAYDRLKPIIQQGANQYFSQVWSVIFMTLPDFLYGLGIAPFADSIHFTVEVDDGSRQSGWLKPMDSAAEWVYIYPEPALYRQHLRASFEVAHLSDDSTLYVNFMRYPELRRNAADLFTRLDTLEVGRLIFDLRNNDGGDLTQARKYIFPELVKRPRYNRKGVLYVLIGEFTYSAAIATTGDFMRLTEATLVGTPTTERPNGYAENGPFRLSESGIRGSASALYYTFVEGSDADAIYPEVTIETSWKQFRVGHDPVMEWVLAQPLP